MTRKKPKQNQEEGQGLFLNQELLKGMIEKLVQQVLHEELDEYLGAGYYERTTGRKGQRNGYKPRSMKTRVGNLSLQIPQVRQGGWFPTIFERYQRTERALICTMQEMVMNGVSTRKVSNVLEEMCGFEVSAGTVSKTMQEMDEEINRFLNRPLADKNYPYLIVDARYENVRSNNVIVKKAFLIVAGIEESGQREILGFSVGNSESESCWGDLFSSLKRRGLRGVNMLVSDAHAGIKKAMSRYFQDVAWQRCKVHFTRELLNRVCYRDRKALAADISSIFKCNKPPICMMVAEEVAAKWYKQNPVLSKILLEGIEDCLTTKSLPYLHELRLSSTNMLERIMRECKRRSRVVSIFPNDASCMRYLGMLLIETHEEWLEEKASCSYLGKNPVNRDINMYKMKKTVLENTL